MTKRNPEAIQAGIYKYASAISTTQYVACWMLAGCFALIILFFGL